MLAENIRENIRQAIIEAKGKMFIPENIEHLLTSISFEMYKSGYRDAHRVFKKTFDTVLEKTNNAILK